MQRFKTSIHWDTSMLTWFDVILSVFRYHERSFVISKFWYTMVFLSVLLCKNRYSFRSLGLSSGLLFFSEGRLSIGFLFILWMEFREQFSLPWITSKFIKVCPKVTNDFSRSSILLQKPAFNFLFVNTIRFSYAFLKYTSSCLVLNLSFNCFIIM